MKDGTTATMEAPTTPAAAETTTAEQFEAGGCKQPFELSPVDIAQTVKAYATDGQQALIPPDAGCAFVNDALIALGVERGGRSSAKVHKLPRQYKAFLRAVEQAPECLRAVVYNVLTISVGDTIKTWDQLDMNALALASAHALNAASNAKLREPRE